MLNTLQNFYKAIVTDAWESGTGNRYVSVLPTPTSGRLVVNPSNATKREIVEYSAVGTDGGGNYVTLSARGVGGTTDQDHDINEPVRMNLTAEDYADVQDELDTIQDEIDTLVLQNAPNASDTVKGIAKLSVAAIESGTPIVVGDNDPRIEKVDDIPDEFVDTSAGAVDEGKVPKLNSEGKLDSSFLKNVFGGTGSDGDLIVSSGIENIDLGGKRVVIKNYKNISITGTGKVTFSNKHNSGTIIIFKCLGNVLITSTENPAIDLRDIGSNPATKPTGLYFSNTTNVHGTSGGWGTAGVGGSSPNPVNVYSLNATNVLGVKNLFISSGAGGGNGGQGSNSTPGVGGLGGGSLLVECNGSLNFTGNINASGGNGTDGIPSGTTSRGSGGGAGGGAGNVIILYNNLIANTGTITSTGGNGGKGASPGGVQTGDDGGGGGGGASYVGSGGSGGSAGVGGNGGIGAGGGGGGARGSIYNGGAGGLSMGGYVWKNELNISY